MKAALCILLVSVLLSTGCSKSSSRSYTEDWQLVQKSSVNIGPGLRVESPAADSSVLLLLDSRKGRYISELNNRTVSEGSYSINTDTAYNNAQYLELNDFKTTGIFNLFTLEQIGANNQVVSVFNGLFMHTSGDSLMLSSGITPGGFVSYIFKKKK